jgi:hypothetical protein
LHIPGLKIAHIKIPRNIVDAFGTLTAWRHMKTSSLKRKDQVRTVWWNQRSRKKDKRKSTKWQTVIHKTLHRKLKNPQSEPHNKSGDELRLS